VDIIRTAYYIRGLELMKLIFAVLDVSLTMGLTRCYKTEGLFTFIQDKTSKVNVMTGSIMAEAYGLDSRRLTCFNFYRTYNLPDRSASLIKCVNLPEVLGLM